MLIEIAKNEVPQLQHGRRSNYATITLQAFIDSGMEAAVVDIPDKEPRRIQQAMQNAITRKKAPVQVISRKGTVYLVREEVK